MVSRLFSLSFHLAPFSASHFRITSATWRLFLSIIIMWLLPLMPMSGRTASAARPPAALIALTASRQPLRLASPLTVCLAPTLLSPHSESTGTLAKCEAASLSLKPSQPPSTVTSAHQLRALAHQVQAVHARLRMDDDDRGADAVEQRGERGHRVDADSRERSLRVRHELHRVLLHRLDRKLQSGKRHRPG